MAANRIFIVEDEKAISDFITSNLECTGYEHFVLDNGSEVAACLESDHAFDLALLDVMLPGLDGFDLLPLMQKYKIPVIYLTAKADVYSKIKGLRSGAEDYIVKPFDVLELLVRIEKVLDRTGKLNRILHFGDVTVDLEDRTVLRGDVNISLKPLEFDLLAMLLKYKNRTLPRERLLNEIWGADYFGGTHTLDVHIAQIRKKLNLSDEIKTISKVGYRLED